MSSDVEKTAEEQQLSEKIGSLQQIATLQVKQK